MNVNLDVLELIFAQLDGTDLVASAQVSRAFLAGAIPSLYASVEYTTRHAKRARSPFATLAAHDNLGVHVKRIAIYSAPLMQSAPNIVNPAFLDELTRALRTTTNLRSFVCAVKILAPLTPHIVDKPRLRHLRICAPIASRQMVVLQDRTGLHSLVLDFPSWCVIDALPNWTAAMQKTLAHLTLFMSQDMDATVLNATLAQLPRLRGLHVIGCPRITHTTVLKALSHTPDIRELSFTIFPSQDTTLPTLNFCMPPLTHLSIDVRASYPGLKPLIARIVSRLSPRDALAICGGWIGEIKSSSERTEPPPDSSAPPAAPGEGGGRGDSQHGHDHGNGHPPLLTPAVLHPGIAPSNPNHGAPPPTLPTTIFGFPFPLGNPNPSGNDNNPPGGGHPNPPNPSTHSDPTSPSLVSSLPSTLSSLHLPQISLAGLREVVNHCQDIQLLGIVLGNTFASSPPSVKSGKTTGPLHGRSNSHPTNSGVVRPEITALAGILSRAKALRELIMDTSPTNISFGNGNGAGTAAGSGGSHGPSSRSYAVLTPTAVRMLMRDSPLLRRIVAEGRVWESPTPIPPTPIGFPNCLDIDLKLRRAHYGPGANYNHVHGPPGFGNHGGGYGQVEAGNDHWFWLTDSASSGRVYSEF